MPGTLSVTPTATMPRRRFAHPGVLRRCLVATVIAAVALAAAVVTAPAAPAASAPSTSFGGAGSMVLRAVMGPGIVIVLLYGGARYVLPRLQGMTGAAKGEIDIVSRATLGGRRQVVLVATRGRTYLVGVTDHSVSLIDEVDGGTDAGASAAVSARTVTARTAT